VKVLILGGTIDARQLALVAIRSIPNLEIVYSLAGATTDPQVPENVEVRVGGFGGVEGLVNYLHTAGIDRSIDCTHPFAARISAHAAAAAAQCQILHAIFDRPGWQPQPGDNWLAVDSLESAATLIAEHQFQRVFLSIGRQELGVFAHLCPIQFLIRSIEPPLPPYPAGEIILARGPFSVAAEIELLKEYQIDAIVTKNSGGEATYAKIVAARTLNLPVAIVRRPPLPLGTQVSTLAEAMDWLSLNC
jgi:precorrin-6A/cobalt-precorrin-6A reductase